MDVGALAASGATTLVGLMVSESWNQVRGRVARFFGRAGDEDAAGAELELSRAELAEAREQGDEEAAADVQAALRARFRRALREHPETAEELRALLDELAPQSGGARTGAGDVHNAVDGTVNGVVVQGRDMAGLNFWAAPQGGPVRGAGPGSGSGAGSGASSTSTPSQGPGPGSGGAEAEPEY
ncbi:hypothetical protein AB0J21_05420 [Streptomyces sp. NPDC049954]|uniref:hypothetical protein n=1 Tax=Streptomyces sp. NPDC049954 TaxID=3155779 RepID=UPI00343318C1